MHLLKRKKKKKQSAFQAVTLETYPDELSLTVWICLLGTIEGSILALIMERGKPSVWAIRWDTKLLAATYSVRLKQKDTRV